jgi:hypothetical protein
MKEILLSFAGALATAIGGMLIAWLFARVRSGRLARTLDQATKVIDFVERCSAAYEGLVKITEPTKGGVEKLLLDAVHAVQEDFAIERAIVPEFTKTTSSVRSAMLLYHPSRTVMWLPHLIFHTLLLFMLYVFAIRAAQGRWGIEDSVVLLVTGVCAALVRLIVYLSSRMGVVEIPAR